MEERRIKNRQQIHAAKPLTGSAQQKHTPQKKQMPGAQKRIARISVPVLNGLQMLDTDDIVKCVAHERNTEIVLSSGSTYIVAKVLKEYELMLADFNFYRIHHSCLINLRHVSRYIKGDGGQVIMSNGEHCEVSRRKKTGLLNRLSIIVL